MVTFIGWASITLGGAYAAFILVTIIADRLLGGGLEKTIPAVIAGATVALLWIIGAIWMSPLTITITSS